MDRAEQGRRAQRFFELHASPEILLLANAWDVASAKLIERAGARAVATTSSGLAQSLGYADGNRLPRELAVQASQRIAASVEVPVSADIEEGYGETPEDVAETAAQLVEAGVVGINLEDGAQPPELLVAKIRAIRKRSADLGARLFINARADVYLRGSEKDAASAQAETLRRADLYREAGADGLFVPGVVDPEAIARICARAGLPVNVLVRPGLPAPQELSRLGVSRLSVGSGVMRAAFGLAERCARDLFEHGRYESFLEGAPSHQELNALFAAPQDGRRSSGAR